MQALWMIVASLCFACMGVCIKLAAETFATAEIVFYRGFISLLLMFPLMRLRRVAMATPHWRMQLQRAASGFVSLVFYFLAIVMLPLATAVTLNYTSPLFLAVFLAAFRRARLRGATFGALLIGFSGVALLLQPTLGEGQLWGGLSGLASGVLAGLAYFHVRELGERGEPEERTVFYFSLLSSVGGAFWMVFGELHAIDIRNAGLLLGVGGFATIAQLAMTRAYRRGKTLVAASLAYSTVIFSSLFGILLWGDVLTAGAWLAITLIVASGILATRHSRANPPAQD